MAEKHVYLFSEADSKDKQLLGGKGAGLAAMTQAGLPVPPGFTVTTEACRAFYREDRKLPPGLMEQARQAIGNLEMATGKGFGSLENPLLLSVRSGSAISMPGMMDTILNLGLNDQSVEGLARRTGNGRFAYDAYRRFISLFSKITLKVDDALFDKAMDRRKEEKGVKLDTELDENDLKRLVEEYKKIVLEQTGAPLPSDPYKQLEMSIEGVFASWEGKRCVDYRKQFKIGPDVANGTAANVQTMVFGNMGPSSATGVAFTRDPATGENHFFGEYLVNAQGEDVVAGIRTPKVLDELAQEMPRLYKELDEVRHTLEEYYKEVQDLEFTIEDGKLYILQTRNGKMNAAARVRTSVEMEKEGLLSRDDALLRMDPNDIETMLHKQLDPKVSTPPVAVGLPASPGVAVGAVVFDADLAVEEHQKGKKVMLVREETKPEDIHGFFASEGILTSRGGKTSHAAVVARGMGKPCVSGAEDISINMQGKFAMVGKVKICAGDVITIDGSTGRVWTGEMPTIDATVSHELGTILEWADQRRRLGVRANANTPEEAKKARELGGQGIGLCRTERMFNAPDRLPIVQKMILAENSETRQKEIDLLLPMQKSDFKEIFRAMSGLPVTIRLLDPPLHEFLPSESDLSQEILDMKKNGADGAVLQEKKRTLEKVAALAEINPMLGHRGVRLGITYPEIYAMQIRAILESAAELKKEGLEAKVEIMVPQVCTAQELRWARELVDRIEEEVEKNTGVKVNFQFGTMIEVVRACLRAGKLAEYAQFFSFGTNDLTQATFSFSREDAENKFLPLYREKEILQRNP
ncbi:MAG: pyruvate, phosphate dikinase, partial [Candidatus Thermoplasmatota archaeon]|nr:pyruvate, phosphate dikinase [Candidatus Thermoplasmatota archaeon]